jgi:hypothetical protein
MMEEMRFYETSALASATRRNIPEDGILLRVIAHKRIFSPLEKNLD